VNSLEAYQEVYSYWYDQVPSYWKKTKNKYVFCQEKHVVGEDWEKFKLLTMGKSGVKPRDMDGGGKYPASFETYQTVEPNQLIFCLFDLDETPRTIGMSKDYGMITSAYDVFSTTEGNDPKFWTYFYQMIDDHKGLRPFYTGLRKVVRFETFMGIEVFSPPPEEQKLISRYLDKKTDQTNQLIEKIEKKIELLKEQRTSLINEYVTKGLNPNVEMKECGIKWISEIPKHWEIKKISDLYSQSSIKGYADEENLSVFRDYGVVRRDDYENKNALPEDLSNYKLVNKGDLVLNKMKTWMGSLGVSDYRGIVSPAYYVLKPNFDFFAGYLHNLLRSKTYIDQYASVSKGVRPGQWDLSLYDFKSLKIILPPIDEQIQIHSILTKQLEVNRHLQELENLKLQKLREYIQSLTASVMTGKIKIFENML
jgi:type I restriction enzyme, S subunit